jgi:mono/diheme cytochrome c family protein
MQSWPRVSVLGLWFLSSACLAAGDGAGLYKQNCSSCHGAAGIATKKGIRLKTPPINAAAIAGQTDSQLAEKTKGHMPAFKGKLTDQQISDVVKYVKTLK